MEPFYITTDEFWEWFNRTEDPPEEIIKPSSSKRMRPTITASSVTATSVTATSVTASSVTASSEGERLLVMYSRHKPGKKNKVWEADGYLRIVDGMAYLSDLLGRMVEEPKVLDELDLRLIQEKSDFLIGNTEVQIVDDTD